MIPKVDNLGNELTDIASAAHHYLFYGPLKVEGSYIDPDKKGHWRDDQTQPHDQLVTFAEESPEMDSAMKQLAAYVGEVANQWGIFVVKEGKQGIQTWTVPNSMYRQGEPAETVALSPSKSAQEPPATPGVEPPVQPVEEAQPVLGSKA